MKAKINFKINGLILISCLAISLNCFATSVDSEKPEAGNSNSVVGDAATPASIVENVAKENSITAATATNPYQQLAKLAFNGKGTDGINSYKDAAATYCKRTRDYNDADAAFAMGWMYMNGRGVEKDVHIAALFFSKALAQGNERARLWLATGEGNPNLAVIPTCLLPDPASAKMVNLAEPEAEIKPFYVKGPIYKLVSKLAPNYKIEPDLAMAFIAVESNFNANATSAKNAQGLMQLIPETASRFNVKNAYDPEQNIKGGLAYLQWLLAYFEGDVQLVAAAYNAGENTVNKYNGVPPYPETKKYVQKIAALYTRKHHPYRDDLDVGKSTALASMQNLR